MPFANLVRQIKQLLPCPFILAPLIFVCFKGLVIVHIAVIENHMKMHMSLVNMDGEKVLIFAFEEFFT